MNGSLLARVLVVGLGLIVLQTSLSIADDENPKTTTKDADTDKKRAAKPQPIEIAGGKLLASNVPTIHVCFDLTDVCLQESMVHQV